MTPSESHQRLACEGGAAAFPAGPPHWPPSNEAVAEALRRAAEDGSWGRYDGPHGTRLAAALGELHQVDHVLLCSSGTIAVELALRGAGVSAGDEVILAGYDFPGNFRAIEAIGARPVLVDLAPGRWTIDVEALDEAWSPSVKALVVSHLHGTLAPMARIMDAARARGVVVLEDACQAPGAMVDGQRAGTWGDVSVLSFGGSKLLTAGRGGAVLSRQAAIVQRAKIFHERGNQAFPLSELQAAVLVPQIATLLHDNARRQAAVERLRAGLAGCRCLTAAVGVTPDHQPSFYKLSWFFESHAVEGATREKLISAARAEGLALDEGFRGFAGRSAHRCRSVGSLENARRAATQTVLLHHPILLADPPTLDLVVETLLRLATRLGA